jgi:predicted amidohydrolase
MTVTIAAVQMDCKLGDKKENLQAIQRKAGELSKRGVDIACFPELATTGYALDEKWFKFSETVPGPSSQAIGKTAREHGMYLIVGIAELDGDRKRIYDSAMLFAPDGEVSGVYRKVHLWAAERTYFTPGDRFPIFKTKFGNVGIGICYDIEFPEPARIMAIAGAELIFFPSAEPAWMRRHIDIYAQSRAAENCVFVAFSNRSGREGKLVYLGKSQIVSPSCKVLARVRGRSGFAISKIDFRELESDRLALPYLQHRIPSAYGMLQHVHEASAELVQR